MPIHARRFFLLTLTVALSIAATPNSHAAQAEGSGAAPVEREVEFAGGAEGVSLAGSLTLPEGADEANPVACVVLVTGSGPQDRNETVLGKQPFLVLAEGLVVRGYAVLRYDDRGTAELNMGASTGSFADATTRDFADDAAAAIAFASEQPGVDPERLVLAGHSEGGMVAAILLASDAPPAAAVLLASPAVDGAAILGAQ